MRAQNRAARECRVHVRIVQGAVRHAHAQRPFGERVFLRLDAAQPRDDLLWARQLRARDALIAQSESGHLQQIDRHGREAYPPRARAACLPSAYVIVCPNCGQQNPEGFKFCGNCASPLEPAAQAREQRKTVTVLFCDVTGSTSLGEKADPEALRALLARYFERMKAIVESHGGTVEKFIGDAVMCVFGVPQVHEDDALRAVRAAIEMRDALPALGIQARIGVNTGEVVTGTAERLATGDAVNVAARLQQAAAPQEILIGRDTYVLVEAVVDAHEVEPLTLRGKAQPVPAYRLAGLTGAPTRRNEAHMVGRATELRRLHDAYDQAVGDRSCQLFTILGSAGVGKSRLVHEFLDGLDATVVARRMPVLRRRHHVLAGHRRRAPAVAAPPGLEAR